MASHGRQITCRRSSAWCNFAVLAKYGLRSCLTHILCFVSYFPFAVCYILAYARLVCNSFGPTTTYLLSETIDINDVMKQI